MTNTESTNTESAKTGSAKTGSAKTASAKTGSTSTGEQGASGRGLKLHHLRPAPGAHKAKTRVGRGEASKGKTAGRGTKGTKARGQVPPGMNFVRCGGG